MAFAAAVPALIAISTAISTGAAVYGGISANQQAQYQARIAEQNAKIAESNATRALQKGQIDAQEQDALTAQTLGEQESAQSASGLSLHSGSAILTRKTARELGRLDALRTIHDSEMEAHGHRTQAWGYRAEAEGARAEGRASLIGGFLSGAGNLVAGAAQTSRAFGTQGSGALARTAPRTTHAARAGF